jgi:PKD repeat protein
MKVNLLGVFLFFSIVSFSQKNVDVNPSCAFDIINAKLFEQPDFSNRMAEFERNFASVDSVTINNRSTLVGATYIIPVVVHIMHNGEDIGVGSNISEQDIKMQIKAINDSFRKTAGSISDGNGVDTGIELALAVRSPSGQCTNGINRVNMSAYSDYIDYGVNPESPQGIGMYHEDLKAISNWNSSQYYNIWVVSKIAYASVLGFANLAALHGQPRDGAVIVFSEFKNSSSRTSIHEIGHAFNLYHTFEGDNNGLSCPTNANGCGLNSGDCCADTPPHIRSNTAVNPCNSTGLNSCNGSSSNNNFVRNYLEYSGNACKNMFTNNQKTRMQLAITSLRSSLLAINGNNKLIPVSSPTANFIANSNLLCSGSVSFFDNSNCIPNTLLNENNWNNVTYSWSLSNGSNTYNSNVQNPTFINVQPGVYSISHTVTNAFGSNTISASNIIYVSNSISSCTPTSTNVGNFGYTVSKVNFNTINKETSNLINDGYQNFICQNNTIVYDGTVYPIQVTINALNSSPTAYNESLAVYIDYNNNGTFQANEQVLTGITSPMTTSIKTANITIPTTAVKNTMLRMRVIGEAITITSGEISCTSPFFISDVEDYGVYILANNLSNIDTNELKFDYYPNPVKQFLNVRFQNENECNSYIIYNSLGQQVQMEKITTNTIVINCNTLASGFYFVSFKNNNKELKTIKIIKI